MIAVSVTLQLAQGSVRGLVPLRSIFYYYKVFGHSCSSGGQEEGTIRGCERERLQRHNVTGRSQAEGRKKRNVKEKERTKWNGKNAWCESGKMHNTTKMGGAAEGRSRNAYIEATRLLPARGSRPEHAKNRRADRKDGKVPGYVLLLQSM